MLKSKPCYYRKLESLEDRENAGYSEYRNSREDEDAWTADEKLTLYTRLILQDIFYFYLSIKWGFSKNLEFYIYGKLSKLDERFFFCQRNIVFSNVIYFY